MLLIRLSLAARFIEAVEPNYFRKEYATWLQHSHLVGVIVQAPCPERTALPRFAVGRITGVKSLFY